MKVRTRRFYGLGALALSLALSGTAVGQLAVMQTPNPTVLLNADPETVPTYNVSGMKIGIGNWTVKPVYRIVGYGTMPLSGQSGFSPSPTRRLWSGPISRPSTTSVRHRTTARNGR
jgi:hypothetical protein